LTLLHVVEFSRYDCALVAKLLLRAGQPIFLVSRHAYKPQKSGFPHPAFF